jgi:hypothetical protein
MLCMKEVKGLIQGGVAQLGERLICIQEVIGSIPFTSTISKMVEKKVQNNDGENIFFKFLGN